MICKSQEQTDIFNDHISKRPVCPSSGRRVPLAPVLLPLYLYCLIDSLMEESLVWELKYAA